MTLNEKIKRYLWEATNTNDYAFVRGNMKLSMREIAEGYQQLQSRVKELEDKALTLGDIHEAHIIIIKQLERKLKVARDALLVCKQKSGVKMDYGSDSDAIQAIYITSTKALTATDTKPEAGEG